MMNTNNSRDLVIIEPVYPHSMLLHISRLTGGDETMLKDERVFLGRYSDTFSDVDNEILLLKLAYDKNIVAAFFECNKREQWRKRVLIEKSVNVLVASVAEKYAVMVVESLMFAFGWRFRLDIRRGWEAGEDEKALFHEKTVLEKRLQNDIVGQIHITSNNKRINVSEYSDEDTQSGAFKDNSVSGNIGMENNENYMDSGDYNKENNKTSLKHGKKNNKEKKRHVPVQEKEPCVPDNNPYEDMVDVKNEKIEESRYYNIMNLRNRRVLKKAFQGNASSQCEMGDYYSEKDSSHTDYKEAARWYSTSAKKGYERAFFELGKLYDQNPPEIEGAKEKAFSIYNEMAGQGLPTAQCILGMKYWFGDGVETDFKKAVLWLQKAADQKHEAAIRSLGDLYSAMSDSENAYRWYKAGAEIGDEYCRRKMRREKPV